MRVVVSWSTGKDAAWCLRELRARPGVEVVGLATTVTPSFGRVSVHGTRLEVLHAQCEGLGLPLCRIEIPYPCSNDEYESAMEASIRAMSERWQPTHVAFGDLFLEDVRAYREARMARTSLEPLFPLWGRCTAELAAEMTAGDLRAVVVAAQAGSGAEEFVGRPWDEELLALLPPEVDPCGENGEFHTCLVGGAGLAPLPYHMGETVQRDGAVYRDLLLDPR